MQAVRPALRRAHVRLAWAEFASQVGEGSNPTGCFASGLVEKRKVSDRIERKMGVKKPALGGLEWGVALV